MILLSVRQLESTAERHLRQPNLRDAAASARVRSTQQCQLRTPLNLLREHDPPLHFLVHGTMLLFQVQEIEPRLERGHRQCLLPILLDRQQDRVQAHR